MLRVALTGNVASGKSTVARLWREAGVPVVSADDLSREVVEPGTPGLDEVRRVFGDGVVASDGTLDRAALRDRVFRDADARERLEAILHPRIERRRRAWMEDREGEGATLAVAEIPLLFEVGLQEAFDVTVLVDAPEDVRLERLVAGRGLDRDEARRVMEAQMAPERKRRLADIVVDNGGTVDELRARAAEVLEGLRDRAASATTTEE
ncbi:MAG TPA: dephospho-CoA kinase [Longimicrobiales bacterium]|nr:dephospho-CoA kinase [Longimicrobiales bacterium]